MTITDDGVVLRDKKDDGVALPDAKDDRVVLLDENGVAIGDQDRRAVHSEVTPLHLAFSLYLFDDAGRVLFTRRALEKATWPGVWTNSCCGHPRPGEDMEVALRRRLHEELGAEVTDLSCALPDFAYRARDVSGIWENEVCPVFVGRLVHPPASLRPNSDEVMDLIWVDWTNLVTAVTGAPFAFSPWAVEQVSRLPTPDPNHQHHAPIDDGGREQREHFPAVRVGPR